MRLVRCIATHNSYNYAEGSDIEMDILGLFLVDDVSQNIESFRTWGKRTDWIEGGGNCTDLEKESGAVYLRNRYLAEKSELKMTIHQFIKLLDDWEEQVLKKRPAEVIIVYQHGEFSIETK